MVPVVYPKNCVRFSNYIRIFGLLHMKIRIFKLSSKRGMHTASNIYLFEDKDQQLLTAVQTGNLHRVKQLVSSGVRIAHFYTARYFVEKKTPCLYKRVCNFKY